MAATSFSTPLGCISAVVLDTETTGLDARTARLLQIGALKIEGTRIEADQRLERLVNPGMPIPKVSTTIHGITDDHVRTAPPFTDCIAELEAFLGTSIVIGHTPSYDMAILKREYSLAGKLWRPRRLLDIRVLAEIAVPTLAHFDLDGICAWAGIEIEGRHTAMGDAMATAKAFLVLIPHLRQRSVRTLAEAEAASRAHAEGQARAAGGMPAAEESVQDVEQPPRQRSTSAYRHRVREIMAHPPVTATAQQTVADAVRLMLERKTSSVYVKEEAGPWGIVTERDVLRALHAKGDACLSASLGSIMSAPLKTIADHAFVYKAIGRIQRLGVRHLGVHNADGEIVGALTARNLLYDRADTGIILGDEIDAAEDAVSLGRAWARLPLVARELAAEDIDARHIAGVISSELRNATRRAAQLAEASMTADGKGPPPVPYCVLVLGSAGRGESLLAADQDNAIVYEHGAPDGAEDRWFAEMASRMADTLDAVGIVYCKGGIMAKSPQWRMSLARWNETIEGWVRRKRPRDLLNIDIFFDGIPVHGDIALGEAVWNRAWEVGHGSTDFIKLLTELARQWTSPLTLFGGFRQDGKGRVDLKLGGLLPVFTAARVLALRHNVRRRSTPERIAGVRTQARASDSDIDAVIEAHRRLLGTILGQQLIDTEAGTPLSSRVEVRTMAKSAQRELRSAVQQVDTLIGILSEGRF
jgi:DNA polymerase-3 subunit epsilon/CBS domain-containing protein